MRIQKSLPQSLPQQRFVIIFEFQNLIMKVKFYLKRPSSPSETSIFALLNYDGNSVKIYTDESILPKYWNPTTQLVRTSSYFRESPEFNQRLNNIRSTINEVFLDYRNSYEHAIPPPSVLKPLIETALKKGVSKTTFLTYYEDFVNRSFAGQRIDPRSRKSVGRGVSRGYKTTLNHLLEFNKVWKRKIDFATIDLEFHKDFTNYLSLAPRSLSLNTIGGNFQRIKAVLAEATDKGINSNLGFKSKYFVKQSEEADNIYLNESELKAMEKLDLKDNPKLDNVRDLFLIGSFTGLRFSDFSILQSKDIANGFIKMIQTKTGDPVTIPIHPVVKRLLKKHEGEIPRAISNSKMNKYLKEVAEMIKELKVKESKKITQGGAKIIKTMMKWEMVSTHTARRSFATNEFKAGTPPLTIMAITGHKTEKSFLKYIRVTPDEHAQRIKILWDKRHSKLKVV